MSNAANNLVFTHYVAAVNKVMELDTAMDTLLKNTITCLRGLKSGDLSIESVVVTDNGFEIMPDPPAVSNGHSKTAVPPKVEAVA